MRLVYLDESARDDRFYFFGALIVDSQAIRHIEQGLDSIGDLLARHVPGFSSSSEFHAHDMFHGKGDWDCVPTPWRVKACALIAKVLARSSGRFVFRGVDLAAQRLRYRVPFPPHLLTLAHTLQDIDKHLRRLDPHEQLGLVLADEHHSAPGARRSFRDFRLERVPGYTTRPVTRIADTIYFGPSHESRLLQAADLATYFLNRDRTVTTRDERSRRAIAKIAASIREITVSEYVWCP
ncbi:MULTISPECIES: DUF3800 domain-containing protein [unclassified Microbacterium]|uniref:DUF3800 domain-containing protein n=1 Tax=unclassified Microbacterium TaxID=2609290 RepID=UPI00300FCC49